MMELRRSLPPQSLRTSAFQILLAHKSKRVEELSPNLGDERGQAAAA